MRIIYTALRSLISGHTASTEYTLETGATMVRPGREYDRSAQKSLDGTLEVLLRRYDKTWFIATGLITEAEQPQWEEFLDSVAAGENFDVDLFGTIANPGTAVTVVMDSPPTEPEVVTLLPLYRYSFTAREAA